MKTQAERFGAEYESDEVIGVDFATHPFVVKTNENEHTAKAVIITTGASPRKLNVPGEKEFTGRGVSYCATCDGFFFRDKDVVVVGGGDSAMEEGTFLTKFANAVRVVHRRDQLRAGPTLAGRAQRNEKVSFIWDTQVREIVGNGSVEAVELENVKTGEQSTLKTDGVFIYIGHIPNTSLFKDQLEMDEEGYLIVDRMMHTSVEGVFAAGEVADPHFRQIVTSAGMGAQAAIEAERFIARLEDRAYPGA